MNWFHIYLTLHSSIICLYILFLPCLISDHHKQSRIIFPFWIITSPFILPLNEPTIILHLLNKFSFPIFFFFLNFSFRRRRSWLKVGNLLVKTVINFSPFLVSSIISKINSTYFHYFSCVQLFCFISHHAPFLTYIHGYKARVFRFSLFLFFISLVSKYSAASIIFAE